MKTVPREKVKELFLSGATFMRGAVDAASLPKPFMPEIAFIGRSNVGKSSLINAITGEKGLAKVSNTPGRTQQLNFFRLADRFIIVDMPGYGFAKAEKGAIASWQQLIDLYLRERPSLKRLCLLIDARHGLKENDRDMLETLKSYAVPFVAVLTKSDKIKPTELVQVKEAVTQALKNYGAAWPDVFATSSEKKEGLDALRAFLAQCIIEG